jgi:capsular exopolysaccharide synthesis family protein
MSRINEAMQRAGASVPETTDTVSADETFVPGEGGGLSSEPPNSDRTDDGVRAGVIQVPPVRMRARQAIQRVSPAPLELKTAAAGDEVDLRQVLQMLLGRWRSITVVMVASVGLAVAYNALSTKIYESRARLLIEPDSSQVVPFKAGSDDTIRYDYFGTQLDILRSRELARRTLERLKLLSADPKEQGAQIGLLSASIVVAPAKLDGTSRTVNLAVRSTEPEYAARLANGVAETYVEQNLELRRKGNREAAAWLTERLAELRQDVTATASAVQQYREQKNAVSLDDKSNIVVQNMNQLSTAVTEVRAEKVQKQATYQQLAALQKSGAALDTFPPILSNTYIQTLKGELNGLQQKRQQMSNQLGDRHPEMQKIDAEIAVSSQKLAEETSKVAQSIREDYEMASAREQQLEKALGQQQREVLDLNRKAIVYGSLQRDATSSQQIFETVLQRLKEAELSAELQTNNVRVLDPALVPRVPILPRKQLNMSVGIALGFVLAIGLAFILEYFNPRISNANGVSDALGAPLLGVTPRVAALKKGRARYETLPAAFQEAMRGIRTRIIVSAQHGDVRTLAVTSTVPKEGKTVVAASFAASMAMAGRRVLLIDADLRRAQVHKIFATRISPGMSEVLAGEAKPSEALIESEVPGLFLMPAGTHAGGSDLLATEAVRQLVEGLHQIFDLIVLDCPPVMAVADASIVANVATSVLFVVGAGSTNTEAARAAIDRLASVQAQVVGVVLNKATASTGSPYGYSSYEYVEGEA